MKSLKKSGGKKGSDKNNSSTSNFLIHNTQILSSNHMHQNSFWHKNKLVKQANSW
jgi:hypothetical protein